VVCRCEEAPALLAMDNEPYAVALHSAMADNRASRPASQRRWERAAWLVLLRIPELLVALLLGVLVVFMTISVFSRYVLNVGMPWSDEVGRLLFIWIVYIGFAIGVRHRGHIAIDWAVVRFGPRLRQGIVALQDILILLFSLFFTWQALITVKFSFLQRLPELQISIAWLYMAVLVAAVLMTIYAVANLWETLRGRVAHADAAVADAVRHVE
jgi:TRAP-type transport system small permease protein